MAGSPEYRPILLARKGEITAWTLSFVIFATLLILVLLNDTVPLFAAFMAVLFLIFACSISFGNWLDRKTIIRVADEGITYQNGLRKSYFPWNEIHELHMIPSRWGTKIRVLGDESGFSFNLMREIIVNGEIKGHVGFEHGEEILEVLLNKGELHLGKEDNTGAYYYRQ